MKLSEIKQHLAAAESVDFQLEDGTMVPAHFHVTEVGIISKDFIDCGGVVRHEKVANFQLWNAEDHDHRLKAAKLLDIIALSEKVLGMEDLEVEVEYQAQTIGKYGLEYNGSNFVLMSKQTTCLAPDKCGLPESKPKFQMQNLSASGAVCVPGGGCC